MNLDVLLKRLDEEQAALAKSALSQPQAKDAFEYGRMVGMYSGIERVRAMLNDIMSDADKRSNNL